MDSTLLLCRSKKKSLKKFSSRDFFFSDHHPISNTLCIVQYFDMFGKYLLLTIITNTKIVYSVYFTLVYIYFTCQYIKKSRLSDTILSHYTDTFTLTKFMRKIRKNFFLLSSLSIKTLPYMRQSNNFISQSWSFITIGTSYFYLFRTQC